MNDIEKLHQVIDALEEQSSRVTEFNGVLSAVNSAREQIESAKTLLVEFAVEQKDLVSESNKCFKGYGEKLAQLESQLGTIGETENKIIKELLALEFVTPEMYEQGRTATEKEISGKLAQLESLVSSLGEKQNMIIRELSVLEFVTPEMYEQGRAATEKEIAKKLAELAEKTNIASAVQQAATISLRRLVIFGILALAACIAFF